MTKLQALLEAHQSTRLLRLSFPMDDGPQAKLMVNRLVGTEYLSRDFEFKIDLLTFNFNGTRVWARQPNLCLLGKFTGC